MESPRTQILARTDFIDFSMSLPQRQTVPRQGTKIAHFGESSAAPLRSPLRVAVLMDGPDAPLWVHQTIAEILRSEHLTLSLIIVNMCEKPGYSSRPALLRAWRWADRRLFKERRDVLRCERREYDAESILARSLWRGDELVIGESAEEKIKAAQLDVIVDFATAAVPRKMWNWAKYGTWTFSSGIGSVWESDHAGFEEICEGNPVSSLTLRALTVGGEHHLYRSTFSYDYLTFRRNQNTACRRKSQIILRRLADLYQRSWPALPLPNKPPDNVGASRNKSHMTTAAVAGFLARWSLRAFRRLASNLAPAEQWFIAYRDKLQSSGKSAALRMLIPSGDWSYADPFLYEWRGKHYIFFENVGDSHPRGEIWFVELDEDGNAGQPERALARDYHLSYPQVFGWRGETYMLPETCQNASVEIYRAVDFPRRWELAATLLTNVRAADSTIFEHGGKLWLFTAGIGGKDLGCSELSLFFSDSLFGPWMPHPKNPIVCDVSGARPAGSLFYEAGELIRPAQDCSQRYGYAISLNRVDVLSETDYRETRVGKILPEWAEGLCASHTLNMDSRYEVLDGFGKLRYAFAGGRREIKLKPEVGPRKGLAYGDHCRA
jgi:hypothetical protein